MWNFENVPERSTGQGGAHLNTVSGLAKRRGFYLRSHRGRPGLFKLVNRTTGKIALHQKRLPALRAWLVTQPTLHHRMRAIWTPGVAPAHPWTATR